MYHNVINRVFCFDNCLNTKFRILLLLSGSVQRGIWHKHYTLHSLVLVAFRVAVTKRITVGSSKNLPTFFSLGSGGNRPPKRRWIFSKLQDVASQRAVMLSTAILSVFWWLVLLKSTSIRLWRKMHCDSSKRSWLLVTRCNIPGDENVHQQRAKQGRTQGGLPGCRPPPKPPKTEI